MAPPLTERKPLYDISDTPHPDGLLYAVIDGRLTLFPSPPQLQTLRSSARIVLALAGVRAGKTSIIPFFMTDIMQAAGPGNYIIAAPTYKLLDKAAVPEVRTVMGRILGLGEVIGGASGEFRVGAEGHRRLWPDVPFAEPSRIVFGYAERPASLAAITAKGGALDECGQKSFKHDSWDELLARVSIASGQNGGGRLLLTTRPYVVDQWVKTQVYDLAWAYQDWKKKADPSLPPPRDGGEIEVIHYRSIDNPTFPREEWDRAYRTMPTWKADMVYGGVFTRPAGAVYDCFEDAGPTSHVVPGTGFRVPEGWPISVGVDFGAPNFAAVFLYENMERREGPLRPGEAPKLVGTGQYVAFAEYRPNESKTAAQHVTAMRAIIGAYTTGGAEGRNPELCVGGSASEGQWRAELAAAGWPINEPDQRDVEVGIGRVYAAFRERRLFIMDSCPRLIEDVKSYSRPVDEAGNVLEGLEDKAMFHGADSLRYIASWLFMPAAGYTVAWVG